MLSLLIYLVFAGLAVAPLAPRITRRFPRSSGWVLASLPAAIACVASLLLSDVQRGDIPSFTLPWVPSLGVTLSFRFDGLAMLMTLLVSGIGAVVFVYAREYMGDSPTLGRLNGYLLVFMSSMLGMVLSDNMLAFFVFWELTSISSFFLIGHNHEDPESRSSALQALLVTGGGGLAMLAGLILLSALAGTMEFSGLMPAAEYIRGHDLYVPILLLIAAGAFTKSAQVPFHFWLPNAMTAPTPVSAYLHSATMVKAGVFLFARLHPVLGGTTEYHLLLGVGGGITMLLGAMFAVIQQDLKRLLAYSTVATLGALVMLLGIGTADAVKAAMVLLLAHALYKGALFLVAGAIDHGTGTRMLGSLGGLGSAMPWTGAFAMVAGLSMAGLPPMLGFISKELMYEAKLSAPDAAGWLTAAGVTANVLLVATAGLVAVRPFFGRRRTFPHEPHEVSRSMLAAIALPTVGGVLVGLFPDAVSSFILAPATSAVRGETTIVHLGLWHGINPVFLLSILTLTAGCGLYMVRDAVFDVLDRRGIPHLAIAEQTYNLALKGMVRGSVWLTGTLQSGSLGRYLVVILTTLVVLAAVPLVNHASGWTGIEQHDIRLYEVIILGTMVVGAVLTTLVRSRTFAILALGIVGYGISLLFLMFGAPDLAMTQFAIETLTIVLFVLVVVRLPRFGDHSSRLKRVRDAGLSTLVGAVMAAAVLLVVATPLDGRVSEFYAANSVILAHGRNIVNVILVDFRGFDTLGEITVLSIAALGSFALLKLGRRQRRKP